MRPGHIALTHEIPWFNMLLCLTWKQFEPRCREQNKKNSNAGYLLNETKRYTNKTPDLGTTDKY